MRLLEWFARTEYQNEPREIFLLQQDLHSV